MNPTSILTPAAGSGWPVLSLLIALPLVAAVIVALMRNESRARHVAVVAALAELVLALTMVIGFVPGTADMQYVERHAWIPTLGIGYSVGVDGISLLFVPLAALIACGALLATTGGVRFMPRLFCANVLLMLAATVGIFVALDLFLFYVFYELALIPAFLLIKLWGQGSQRAHAGMKYVLYMLCGSVPLLLGFILVALQHQEVSGNLSFDWATLMATPVEGGRGTLVFALLVLGFAVKGPLLPLHTWMPAAVSEGPVGVGVFLVGLKLGAYGFLRFVMPLAPEASAEWSLVIAALGVTAMLYAALVALVQRNLRRLLAFASISHVGLVTMGLFTLTAEGMQGGVLMLLAMGITSTGLLLLAGSLHARLGSSELSSFGGLTRQMPRLATLFFILGIASVGMPGTLNFNGEFLVLVGSFNLHPALAGTAVLGVILSAGYFLWYYERAFFGPPGRHAAARLPDLNRRETLVAGVLAGLAIMGGLYPAHLQEVTGPSVNALLAHVQAHLPVRVLAQVPAQAQVGTGPVVLTARAAPAR